MDTAITQDTALAEIIELVIGNQTEFTKDTTRANEFAELERQVDQRIAKDKQGQS